MAVRLSVSVSLRVGLLQWCSFPTVLQCMCFNHSICFHGEGVNFSAFPYLQSMIWSRRCTCPTSPAGCVGCGVHPSPRYNCWVLDVVCLLFVRLFWVATHGFECIFCGLLWGGVLSVFPLFGCLWGAVRGMLGLCYVGFYSVLMLKCAFCIVRWFWCGFWDASVTVGLLASISLRARVLWRCSMPNFLQSLCCILCVSIRGEGVFFAFPCLLSKVHSGLLTGPAGLARSVCYGF